MADKNAPVKPMTKSDIVSGIAESTGLTKKDVNSVFEAMAAQIKKSLGKIGSGAYTVPGLMKLVVQRKPATKARKGINPFTKERYGLTFRITKTCQLCPHYIITMWA